jgi:hypothetical protein
VASRYGELPSIRFISSAAPNIDRLLSLHLAPHSRPTSSPGRHISHPNTLPRHRISTPLRLRSPIHLLDRPPRLPLPRQPLLPLPLLIPQQPQPYNQRHTHHTAHHRPGNPPIRQPPTPRLRNSRRRSRRRRRAQRRAILAVPGQVRRRTRGRRRGHVLVERSVEVGGGWPG